MAGLRRSGLSAILIGIVVTQAWRTSLSWSPAATVPHLGAASVAGPVNLNENGVAWTALRSISPHCTVDVRNTSDVETLLLLTVQDIPRRSHLVTVTARPSHDHAPSRVIWNRGHDVEPQPEFPALPPTSAVIEPAAEISRDAAPKEHFFLPSQPGCPTDSAGLSTISTTLVVSTDRVRILWDEAVPFDDNTLSRCRTWAARLEAVLIPGVESVFGPVADRHPDGLLTLVVTPRVQNSASTSSPVEAYVLASDFRQDLERPVSNGCDAIYMHPDLHDDRRDAILIHELTHAAQFCALRRHYGNGPWPLTEWMLEGTAHAAEVLLAHSDRNVAERLQAFGRAPERSPLMVTDSSATGRWRDPGSRGATCSFFTWAARRHGLKAIAKVTLHPHGEGTHWQSATGQTWENLHRDWLISLVTERAVIPRPAVIGSPLTVEIDGSATAVIALPMTNTSLQVAVNTADHCRWRGILVRRPRLQNGSESAPNYWGIGAALASPVTTIR